MTTVTVAGQELHVVDRGHGDPVLFLHAFPFNAAMWEYQYADLEVDHRVVGIDLPGFGASAPAADPAKSSMDGWADLVAGVMRALGLEQPTVVAASMGGYLTFSLIRRHLDLLGPLVLVTSRAKSDDIDTWQRRTDQQASIRAGDDTSTMAKSLVENLLSQVSLDRPELVEYVLALMAHSTPEGWIGALEAMKNRPDAMGALKGMPRKTLVVAGELDRITPLAESTLIARLVADGRLETVPDSAHLPNLENPLAFNELLRGFLGTPAPVADEAPDEVAPVASSEPPPGA